MSSQEILFNPIQCNSDYLLNLNLEEDLSLEGSLFFVMDTKQLFLVKNKTLINMCGGLNIIYGAKEIDYPTNGTEADPNVEFTIDELEQEEFPLINDLILNKDGCFYRVEKVMGNKIYTTRLTLQGSGNVVPGGGGVSSSYSIALTQLEYCFSSKDTDYFIDLTLTGGENLKNQVTKVVLTTGASLKKDPENAQIFQEILGPFKIGTIDKPETHRIPINVEQYKKLFGQQGVTFYVNTYDVTNYVLSESCAISIIDLSLKSTYDQTILTSTENLFHYFGTTQGTFSKISNRKIMFDFYSNDGRFYKSKSVSLGINDVGNKDFELNVQDIPHGSYQLRVYIQGTAGVNSKPITSNIVYHTFVKSENGQNAILAVNLPDKIYQYASNIVHYTYVSDNDTEYTLKLSLDGEKIAQLKISNVVKSYDLYIDKDGAHTLIAEILELGNVKQVFEIQVTTYDGAIPILDPSNSSLMLYLSPRGKSNESVDREEWKDEVRNITGTLEDIQFSQNIGWLTDAETAAPYLSLSSGAKMSFSEKAFSPFAVDPTYVDMKDPQKSKRGMTIELDFELNGVTNYNTELLSCVSKASNDPNSQDYKKRNVGFSIFGDRAEFYNSAKNNLNNAGALSRVSLVEGKRIRITYVIQPKQGNDFPLFLTYVDGIVSGATIFGKTDNFINGESSAKLIANASNGQIKIYGIRFYNYAMSDSEVLNNYIASEPSLTNRQYLYDQNNVYSQEQVSYDLVASDTYNLQIPYMLITGGLETQNTKGGNKFKVKEAPSTIGLPTGKKNYRLVDIFVKYPNTEYFSNYSEKTFSTKTEFFTDLKTASAIKDREPEKDACIMYCQGTSSMEYPVKNLRLRWRDEENYFKVKPNIEPVEIICMKADYMESSGSHNTGAGNLIDSIYREAGLKTPGQLQFDQDNSRIVTCIKGHPCLIFYRTAEDQPITYIGKYNLNLDKATPEPFGFQHDSSDFGYLSVGDTYVDENGNTQTVSENQKINSIHCFEFLDNAVSVCNFLRKFKTSADTFPKHNPDAPETFEEVVVTEDDFDASSLFIQEGGSFKALDSNAEFDANETYYQPRYSYENTWYTTFLNKDGDEVPGWALGFESRYPDGADGKFDADALWPLASWLNELYEMRLSEEAEGLTPDMKEEIYNYTKVESDAKYDTSKTYYIKEEGEYIPAFINSESEFTPADKDYYTRSLIDINFAMTSLERFSREYESYFNKDFLLAYYIITEALLMVDSRVKNLMFATWGREKRTYQNLANETIETNNHIFYPIFYDMDTMLGLDNTGKLKFNYYDEDTDPSLYNGEEVLWNFVRDTLQYDLAAMYKTLESKGLNINKVGSEWAPNSILPYFNSNQATMANEAFYNGDAQYKYISPAVNGYRDLLNGEDVEPGKAPYLYAAQGSRELTREYFVTNRIKYLTGKYTSEQFQKSNRVTFRWYYPKGSDIVVKPTTSFDLTSVSTCYAGILLGANGNILSKKFEGHQTQSINVQEGSQANGTEAYILGATELEDFGDLSTKYMQKFELPSAECKIKTLTLGNPTQGYFNTHWGSKTETSQPIYLNSCKYLENFNLYNCANYNASLNFENCPNISKIYLTGSGVSGISLPDNGALTELRLPTSVTSLEINSHKYLTNDNFSLGTYDYSEIKTSPKKIGDVGGKFINDFSQLTSLIINNTDINTYEMASNARNLTTCKITGFSWTIGEDNQFIKLDIDDTYSPDTYYYWNDEQKTYSNIVDSEVYFENNKEFLRKILPMFETIDAETKSYRLIRIPILDKLKSIDAILAGDIVIDLRKFDGKIVMDEYNLYHTYKDMYPNVNITYQLPEGSTIEEAIKVSCYNIPNINNITQPYATVILQSGQTLRDRLPESPYLDSSNNIVYTHTGWIVGDLSNIPENIEDIPDDGIWSNAQVLNVDTPITSNIFLLPIYKKTPRIYKVELRNTINDSVIELDYKFEDILNEHDQFPIYCDRQIASTNFTERYAYKGLILKANYINGIYDQFVDESMEVAADNISLYAFYDREGVENPTNIKYFETFETEDGIGINLKSKYTSLISGPITLPAKTAENITISALGQFGTPSASKFINAVYFEEGSQYKILGTSTNENCAFAHSTSLTKIDFSNNSGLIKIGYGAFISCNLSNIYLPNSVQFIYGWAFANNNLLFAQDSLLPSSLQFIGRKCFYSTDMSNITSLPSSLKTIESEAFQSSSVKISDFQHLTEIGSSAFSSNFNSIEQIFINQNCTFGDGAFSTYGSSGKLTVIVVNGSAENPWGKNEIIRVFGRNPEAGKIDMSYGGM